MRYHVLTEHPVAVDSRDHTHEAGTMHDSSKNLEFNHRLYPLFDGQIRVLDLGCSGGGFVRTIIDQGHEAIGIEGSDYSTKWDGPGGTEEERSRRKPGKRAEWANIPDHLFTADITKLFSVITHDKDGVDGIALFDLVSCWEVMEHIPEEGLDQLVKNVLSHLARGGIWIMSVSTQVGFHHVTVKHKNWWLELFDKYDLVHDENLVRHFGNEWVRGPDQGAPESFHLCLRRK